jgi:spore germination cell wall hydrolase CwlJ-like protein
MGHVDYSFFFENLTEEELLAGLIYGEARGESDAGRVAVGFVAFNRTLDSRWGSSLRRVALAPLQFSCFNKGDPNRQKVAEAIHRRDPNYLECLDISRRILSGECNDPTSGATHYHADSCRPSWIKSSKMKFLKRIGRHRFYHEDR